MELMDGFTDGVEYLEGAAESRIPDLQLLMNKAITELETEFSCHAKPIATDAEGDLCNRMEVYEFGGESVHEPARGMVHLPLLVVNKGGQPMSVVQDIESIGCSCIEKLNCITLAPAREDLVTSDAYKTLLEKCPKGQTRCSALSTVARVALVVKVRGLDIFEVYLPDGFLYSLNGGMVGTIFEDRVILEERDFNILSYNFGGWLLMGCEREVHYLNIVTRATINLPHLNGVFCDIKGVFSGEPGTENCKTILLVLHRQVSSIMYHVGSRTGWLVNDANFWDDGWIVALCLHRDELYIINGRDGSSACVVASDDGIEVQHGPLPLPGFEEDEDDRIVSFVERGEVLGVIVIRNMNVEAFYMNNDGSYVPILQLRDWIDSRFNIYTVKGGIGRAFPSPPFPPIGQLMVASGVQNIECFRLIDVVTVLKMCGYPTGNRCACTFAWIIT